VGTASIVILGLSLGAATVRSHSGADAVPAPAASLSPAPSLHVVDEQGGQVAWDHRLHVKVEHGTLADVIVNDDTGVELTGVRSSDGQEWTSTESLVPRSTYTVAAGLLDAAGERKLATATVRSSDAHERLIAAISPGDGETVGVGMPVSVRFNRPVAAEHRADVERRLSVTATPGVDGAWHWMSATELHWRPPSYWNPGTQVTVTTDLSHLYLGGEVWGTDRHRSTFKVGDAHVSVADIAAHRMTVTNNGALVRVLLMSAGRDKYPTRGGVHIALSKSQVVTMDSATVGIPRNSPDGYYEKVYWDVRISNGGAFVHAAPWSVGAQGNRNVSHGCINVSPADAQWFYGFSQRGDIVDVKNSPAPPVLWDAGMADWNLSWPAWVAGSALQGAAPSGASPVVAGPKVHTS